MRKSLKSLFGDCNTIMILIILLSILLLSIIWYKKRQYEYFEEQTKEPLSIFKNIQPYTMLGNIDEMYTIPNIPNEIDNDFENGKIVIFGGKDPLKVDENTFKLITKTIVDCINDTNCKGINMFPVVSEPNKLSKLFIYPTRGTNSNNIINMTKEAKDNLLNKLNIRTKIDPKNYGFIPYSLEFTNNKDLFFKDNTNTYQVYMNKVVPSSVKSKTFVNNFDISIFGIDFRNSPFSFIKNPTKDNLIKTFGDGLCNDTQAIKYLGGSFCETLGFTISKDGTMTSYIYTDKADPSKFEKMPDNLVFSIIYSKNKYQEPIIKSSNIKLSGKCENITLKSKDIGKDCFGQLWAENKCNNPIPEYNDDFKALSYEEITKEIKDSSCYTNEDWKKTSYRFVREQALKPIPSSTQLSMPSTSKPNEKSQTTEDGKASSSRMSLVDSAKYILKTMLTPDTAPIYDKEETIKSTEKIDTPTDNKNTVGVSVYQLKV